MHPHNRKIMSSAETMFQPTNFQLVLSTKLPRWRANDISLMVKGSKEEVNQYLHGVMIFSGVLFGLFVLWCLGLLFAKVFHHHCSRKEKECSQRCYALCSKWSWAKCSCCRDNELNPYQMYTTRLSRCRLGFLITGFVLLASILVLVARMSVLHNSYQLVKSGLSDLQQVTANAAKLTSDWMLTTTEAIVYRDHAISGDEVSISHLSQESAAAVAASTGYGQRKLYHELTSDYCPGAPELVRTKYAAVLASFEELESLELSEVSELFNDTRDMSQVTRNASEPLDNVKAWFWSGIAILALLEVAVIAMMLGVALDRWNGWRVDEDQLRDGGRSPEIEEASESEQNRCNPMSPNVMRKWDRILSYVVIPVFVLITCAVWLTTSGFTMALVMNADFCTSVLSEGGHPGKTIVSMLDRAGYNSDDLFETLSYYMDGCTTTDPLEFISPLTTKIQVALSAHKELISLLPTEQNAIYEFCGVENDKHIATHLSIRIQNSGLMAERLSRLLQHSLQTSSVLQCEDISSTYARTAQQTACTSGFNGMVCVLSFSVVVSFSCMTLVTIMIVPKIHSKTNDELRRMMWRYKDNDEEGGSDDTSIVEQHQSIDYDNEDETYDQMLPDYMIDDGSEAEVTEVSLSLSQLEET